MKSAFIYTRVSSPAQAQSGESLQAQLSQAKNYCRLNKIKVLDVYSDKGISGLTTKHRAAFSKLLRDVTKTNVDFIVVYSISRAGRNLGDLIKNVEHLQKHNCSLISLSENLDFASTVGKMLLGILGSVAEWQSNQMKESIMLSKLSLLRSGKPIGTLPYGRLYSKEKGFSIDPEKQKVAQFLADQYLKGKSLRKAASQAGMDYTTAMRIIKQRCGDTWTIKAQGEEFILEVPELLPKSTRDKIKQKIEANKSIPKRKIMRDYLLRGFIYCIECDRTLIGHSQAGKNGNIYGYYTHERTGRNKCKALSGVNADLIESGVMQALFDTVHDIPAFERAIQESIPDSAFIESLESRIATNKDFLKKSEQQLDRLVKAVMEGTIQASTARLNEEQLLESISDLQSDIRIDSERLDNLPTVKQITAEADQIRLSLLDHFSSGEHFDSMKPEDQRALIESVFSGRSENGLRYGVYIKRLDESHLDYMIHARSFTGTRTMNFRKKELNVDYDYDSLSSSSSSFECRKGQF